jgi:hypothetical protein
MKICSFFNFAERQASCHLKWVYGLFIFILLQAFASLRAEPWLGSRFAQNCSGCHAPGRMNLPPKDRRCSLSCQGCHVNPNGGGMRSFYGKWNEQRWLRSFTFEHRTQKNAPLPYKEQLYAQKNTIVDPDATTRPQPLMGHKQMDFDEKLFDRRDGREWVLSRSREEFEEGIPLEDPYRDFDLSTSDGTVALRQMSFQSHFQGKREWRSFIMNVDMGMRFRPLYKNLHLVSEWRLLGDPRKTVPDSMVKKPVVRSLYLMVDDLPFNVFVMTGYYLPLFGHFIPDHTHLMQRLISSAHVGHGASAYRLLFKATSIGTAPNVPYFNLHRIQDSLVRDPASPPVQGWAINAGLRFVTLGASLNYSVWQTEQKPRTDPSQNREDFATKVLMHSINATSTLAFNRWYLGIDLVSIEKDTAESFRRSGLLNLDSRLRLWREFYMTNSWTYARTDDKLMPGYAKQFQWGIQSFLLQGIQWTLAATQEHMQSSQPIEGTYMLSYPSTTTKREIFSSQWHLYL